jgi:hypothetical protein
MWCTTLGMKLWSRIEGCVLFSTDLEVLVFLDVGFGVCLVHSVEFYFFKYQLNLIILNLLLLFAPFNDIMCFE